MLTLYPFSVNDKKGFTLIEILVVLTIIGVVFGVVISSISKVQTSARNSQRKADLAVLKAALQQYYADQGFYPNEWVLDNNAFVSLNGCTGIPADDCDITKVTIYLKQVPHDPRDQYDLSNGNAINTDFHYCYRAQVSKNDSTNPYADRFVRNPDSKFCDDTPGAEKTCQYYKLYAGLEGAAGNDNCKDGTSGHDYVNYVVTPDSR